MPISPSGWPIVDHSDLVLKTLGTPRIDSAFDELLAQRQSSLHYVEEPDRVLVDDTLSSIMARDRPPAELPGFEPAGPRRKIDPSHSIRSLPANSQKARLRPGKAGSNTLTLGPARFIPKPSCACCSKAIRSAAPLCLGDKKYA